MTRRHAACGALVLGLAALAGCAAPAPARVYEAVSYDYLPQLRLNVEAIDVEDRSGPVGNGSVTAQAPIAPATALRRMASDRLKAFGTAGHAVLVIRAASLVRAGDRITGRMDVELDIYTSDDNRVAFAAAEVLQNRIGEVGDLRSTLYDLTNLMMEKMNVELEFQVRRSLKDWLLPDAPSVVPAPVVREDLAAPRS